MVDRPLGGTVSARERAERLARSLAGALGSRDEATTARIDELVQRINHELAFDISPRIAEILATARHLHGRVEDELAAIARAQTYSVDVLQGVVRGQAAMLREILLAPARDEEAARIRASLPTGTARRAGLSIVTTSWNHGRLLPIAMRSARALLDELEDSERGEIWVLDDGSNDDTAEVIASLEAELGVRALRADLSLGLSRARDLLLHAVPTEHALVLDADNVVLPRAAALLRHAVATGSAFTFGPLLLVDPDGSPRGVVSAEPPGDHYLAAGENSIDTMAVVDVEAILAVGGYTRDPILAAADDWEIVHRLARTGHPIGFVPEVVGHYRLSPRRMSAEGRDPAAILHRIERAYRVDGLLDGSGIDVRVALPELPPPTAVPERRRVVVVSGGGVSNVGDDAILEATIRRLAEHAPPEGWAIDLITDGDLLPALPAPCAWLGSLDDVLADLDALELAADDLVVLAGGGGVAAPFATSIVEGRARLVAVARDAGARIIASGQGIGPITPDMAEDVRVLFSACERVSVRDPLSRGALLELGIDAEVVADDAVVLVDGARRAPAGLPERYLLVHVRVAQYNLEDRARWAATGDAIDTLAAERGLDVVGLVINDQDHASELEVLADLARPERAATWHLVHASDDAALAAEVCQAAEGVLVGSYHLAYFALLGGRPAALVVDAPYFDAKAGGLAALFDVPPLAVSPELSASEVGSVWAQVGAALDPGRRSQLADAAAAWWATALSSR